MAENPTHNDIASINAIAAGAAQVLEEIKVLTARRPSESITLREASYNQICDEIRARLGPAAKGQRGLVMAICEPHPTDHAKASVTLANHGPSQLISNLIATYIRSAMDPASFMRLMAILMQHAQGMQAQAEAKSRCRIIDALSADK